MFWEVKSGTIKSDLIRISGDKIKKIYNPSGYLMKLILQSETLAALIAEMTIYLHVLNRNESSSVLDGERFSRRAIASSVLLRTARKPRHSRDEFKDANLRR